MDFIIEAVMEFLMEFLGELYVDLTTSLLPRGRLSERAHKVLTVVFAIIGVAFFLLLFTGLTMLIVSGGASTLGWIFTCVGAVYLIVSLVLFLRKR
ncbi:MAG: hypothetical protein IJX97_03570 [Clostridia bacterium]|nr:hypothetical protein [Clostridia bacterium]